jgi:tRNA-modifying protein YgfZ
MRADWHNFLSKRGATIEQGVVRHFGDTGAELAAARDGAVCCDLSHTGLLLCSGAEASNFLHSQFSSDVAGLGLDASQYASYCSAKGRMLATMLLWKMADGVAMQLPAEMLAAFQARLAMYTLRAKARSENVGERYARFGLAGAPVAQLLADTFGAVPAMPHAVRQLAGGGLIRLGAERFELVLEHTAAEFYWDKLTAALRPAGAPCWDWLDIRAGIPWITGATREQFVPQMANLELIGGVSFKKGCYPGQEIVARTQFLGTVKRRMFLAHIDAAAAPLAGDALFGGALADQESGTIVGAAPAPGGGYDLLAVLQSEGVHAGPIRLGANGPALRMLELHYAA